jgi:hypothetical protein
MKVVEKDGVILAKLVTNEDWSDGLAFYSDDNDNIQVGSWSYCEGKELARHIHNEVSREVGRTQEVLYIRNGKIEAKIYDLNEEYVDTLTALKGDTLILLESGHGYKILENNTQVLEVKNGPYLGADIDRRRF